MRKIDDLIIHCSATKEGKNVTVKDIDRWHRKNGWDGIGYHYVIYLDGSVHEGRNIEKVGAHCKDHNLHSIGICYIGGLDENGNPKDTRTPEQKKALLDLLKKLLRKYPCAGIHGHCDYSSKACPCFDAKNEYLHIRNS